jgi:putative transposase
MRYIELNPVRAGTVEDPADYRWSSYRSNGLGQADLKLTLHPVFLEIPHDAGERQPNYRQFYHAPLDGEAMADMQLTLNPSLPLGNSRFHAKIAQTAGEQREARPRGRPRSTGEGTADGLQQQPDLLADRTRGEGTPK